jgi:ribosomal protein L40E
MGIIDNLRKVLTENKDESILSMFTKVFKGYGDTGNASKTLERMIGLDKDTRCAKCGSTVPKGAVKCPNCGTYVSGMTGWSCPRCGASNPKSADKCSHCSFYINGWTCPKCGASNPKSADKCPYCSKRIGAPAMRMPSYPGADSWWTKGMQKGKLPSPIEPKSTSSGFGGFGGLSILGGGSKNNNMPSPSKKPNDPKFSPGLDKLEGRENYEAILDYIKRQAARGSPMHKYMLQKYNENKGSMDFNKAVKQARQAGILFQAEQKINEAQAGMKSAQTELDAATKSGDGAAIDAAHRKLGGFRDTIERYKKTRLSAFDYSQDDKDITMYQGKKSGDGMLNRLNLSDNATNVLTKAGKKSRMLARMYQALIFILAGIACLFVPNLIGFPISFAYMAIALIIFIPAYIMFPSKYEVLDEYGKNLTGRATAGFLVPKAMFKILAFVFILLQFSLINLPATLILAFIFYFSMPFGYESDQPYELIESWARFGFGVYISILFMIVFGFSNVVGQSLALMAMAFFATVPVHHETSNGVNVVVNFNKKTTSKSDSPLGKLFFVALMLGALVLAYSGGIGFNLGDLSQLLFLIVWILGFIVGISTTAEGRPAMGIVLIFIALFCFSGMYAGVIGQSVFGYWWPQIQSFGETYMGPLSDAWMTAQSSMADSWTIITCPTCYFQKQQQKEQAVKSVVKSGGTKLSIEPTQFNLYPSVPGTLDPVEPLIGTMELTNSGEFDSNYVKLDIWSSYKDVSATAPKEENIGTFQKLTCSGITDVGTPTTSVATCQWTTHTYPNEVKMSTFVYNKGLSGIWVLGNGDDLAQTTRGSSDPTNPNYNIVVYNFSGKAIKVSANITYDYNVNVSIPVEVIGSNRYTDLLINKQIQMIDLTSQYTGGPVKATLWTPKQPIRTGEPSIVVGSVLNEGTGVIKKVTFRIAIPKTLISADELSAATGLSSFENCVGPVDFPPNFYLITCTYNKEIKPQEFKRISFFINPTNDPDTESSTTHITGYAEYNYSKTTTQSLMIANAPAQ